MMPHLRGTQPYRLTGGAVVAAAVAAAALAVAMVSFILRFYAFYHFGVGPGAAVLALGLPGGFAIIFTLLVSTLGVCHRRRIRRLRALTAAALVGLLFVVAVSGYEVWRTAAERSGEGPGAGDLAPFFASLMGLR